MKTSLSKFGRVVAWCLLLTLGSSTLANAAAMLGKVLCIGDDGHVAVEVVRGGNCEHTGNSHSVPEPSDGQQSHCGGCTDLNFSPSEAVSNPQVSKAMERDSADEPPNATIDSSHFLPLAAPIQIPDFRFFEFLDLALFERRTIVLII